MKYYPRPLELWLHQFYRAVSFHTASDMNEELICRYFRVYLHRKPITSFSYENCNYKSITVDTRLTGEEQREAFFHELCHILRHAGWQFNGMPLAFKELQEWDANRFVAYAALPLHMLRNFDLQHPGIIMTLSESFKVTPELCERRLTRIYEQAKRKA